MDFRHHPDHLLPILLVLGLVACRKEEADEPPPVQPAPAGVTLKLEHHVDGAPLMLDTLMYTTASGVLYSVSRLEYYLSEIVILGTQGTVNDTIQGPFYVNSAGVTSFSLGKLGSGTFSGAALLLGLPASTNVSGGLPATLENTNMTWPVPMGGGYHFIKFEGHFVDAGNAVGFAMHVGKNEYLPHADLPQSFSLNGSSGKLVVRFNLNELFRTPHTYDLAAGNYSMGNTALMGQLRDNAVDAFTIAYAP